MPVAVAGAVARWPVVPVNYGHMNNTVPTTDLEDQAASATSPRSEGIDTLSGSGAVARAGQASTGVRRGGDRRGRSGDV